MINNYKIKIYPPGYNFQFDTSKGEDLICEIWFFESIEAIKKRIKENLAEENLYWLDYNPNDFSKPQILKYTDSIDKELAELLPIVLKIEKIIIEDRIPKVGDKFEPFVLKQIAETPEKIVLLFTLR